MEERTLNMLNFEFLKYIFSMLLIFIYCIKSISIFAISKNRKISSYWVSAIPILQGYVLGRICDDINTLKNKKTYFGLCVLILSFINAFCFIRIASLIFFTPTVLNLFYILTVIIRILNLIILVNIYKDYYPKNWILFSVLSAFLWIEFIFLFCLTFSPPNKKINLKELK